MLVLTASNRGLRRSKRKDIGKENGNYELGCCLLSGLGLRDITQKKENQMEKNRILCLCRGILKT